MKANPDPAFSSLILFLFLDVTSSADESTLSEGTDVAGSARYLKTDLTSMLDIVGVTGSCHLLVKRLSEARLRLISWLGLLLSDNF